MPFPPTRRWILLTLAVVVVAIVCVRLGFWQLDRLEGRRASNALVTERLDRPVAPLASLAPGTDDELRYRRVTVTGELDAGRETILFGRPLEGEPGNHVLTPLVTRDGRMLIVDRGWVPIDRDEPPVTDAAPPTGGVRVSGVLIPSEPASTSEGPADAPTGVGSIHVPTLTRGVPRAYEDLYLRLELQTPAQPGELPRPVPLTPPDEGPHLSYAVQWFLFAIIALVGFGALVRKELGRTRLAGPEAAGPRMRRADGGPVPRGSERR